MGQRVSVFVFVVGSLFFAYVLVLRVIRHCGIARLALRLRVRVFVLFTRLRLRLRVRVWVCSSRLRFRSARCPMLWDNA